MQITKSLAFVVSVMAVTAIPVADVDSAAVQVEARDLTRGQCKNACDRGADAMQKFCRLIPEARVRAFCWAAATAVESPLGQLACTSFCDAWF